jgi:hypothetical protein
MASAFTRRPAHPLSAAGVALTTISALLFVLLWILDAAHLIRNPYIGLFAFIALPVLFLLGLLLMPLGVWVARRRVRRGISARPLWPSLDLNEPSARRLALLLLLATVVNVVILMWAGIAAVHYMDSPSFCGAVCHTPMSPQFVQWQQGPHAQIACVACHIGSEPGSFISAKLAGMRRLAHMVGANYPRPIQAAHGTIPASAFTCEECHSPASFSSDRLRVIRTYADDEANSESTTTLRVHIGMNGVHWHANPERVIEYVVSDADEHTIPWVRMTEPGGRVRVFTAEGANSSGHTPPPESLRRMDCLGCHNLPAHPFAPSAERAVDAALADGRLDRSLPFVRRETVRAMSAADSGEIEHKLRDFYHTKYASLVSSRGDAIERTARAARELHEQQVFPSMRVTWGTYVGRIGHTDAPGCFRCHDESHKAADGSVIRQDCTLCHAIEQ